MQKYLPEQRWAYAGMAFIMIMLIVSGLIKTYKNIYAPDMSLGIVLAATWIHNIFFVLFFLAFLGHMAAIVLRPNRPMVRGIFTGKVRLDYARHRHPLWVNDMENEEVSRAAVYQAPLDEAPPAKEVAPPAAEILQEEPEQKSEQSANASTNE